MIFRASGIRMEEITEAISSSQFISRPIYIGMYPFAEAWNTWRAVHTINSVDYCFSSVIKDTTRYFMIRVHCNHLHNKVYM